MAQKEASLLIRIKEAGLEVLDKISSKFTITAGDIADAVTGIASKLKEFGEALFQMALDASKLEDVRKAFNNLAQSQGEDADALLENMKKMTKGTVSELQLMQSAINAVQLGVPIERFSDILFIAQNQAKAMGQSVEFMLNSLVVGLGRGSKQILDNVGIMVDLNMAYKKYADETGQSVKQLNEFEKKQAVMNEALRIGLENTNKIATGTKSLSEEWEATKVRVGELSTDIGALLIPAFTRILKLTNDTIDKSKELFALDDKTRLDNIREELRLIEERNKKLGFDPTPGMTASLQQIKAMLEERMHSEQQNAEVEDMLAEKHQIREQAKLDATKKRLEEEKALKGQQKSEEQIAEDEKKAAEELRLQERLDRQEAENTAKYNAQVAHSIREQEEIIATSKNKETLAAAYRKKEELERKAAYDKKHKDDTLADQFDEMMQQKKYQRAERTMSDLARMQDSKNRQLVAIGKAAATAQIITDTARAVMGVQAWANGIPFVGPAVAAGLSAAIIAYGAEQISRVHSAQMAEGGIVRSQPGGMLATIGEGGRDEAVIPLEDGAPGLGTNIQIVVYGGLMGDEVQARELAVALDKELLKLRRSNQSLAFDSSIV